VICPAAGQGALAIEIREDDGETRAALAGMDDPVSRAETSCERALLAALGGGCQVPIGASAAWRDGKLDLQAVVANPAATLVVRESATGSDPVQVGLAAAKNLLRRGGRAILDEVHGREASMPQQP
jgi:hydroxymethylbilane synthase